MRVWWEVDARSNWGRDVEVASSWGSSRASRVTEAEAGVRCLVWCCVVVVVVQCLGAGLVCSCVVALE